MKGISFALFLLVSLFAGTASAAAMFTQCPPVGVNTGCQFLITVNPGGGFTVQGDPNAPNNGPYDGVEDTLIGVVNNTGGPLSSIALSSNTDIFGFDGDGPCTVTPNPGNCSSDPSGYGGPGVFFSNISSNAFSGTVVFNPPLAQGASAWFGLEEALTAAQLQPGVTASPNYPIPTLSQWAMLLLGTLILALGGLALGRRQR